MKKALYVGSFDPVTFGHMDIVSRASSMFSQVTVAVGDNPSKKYMFDFKERVSLLTRAIDLLNLKNVRVEEQPIRNLTADYARLYGHDVIVKGARTTQDFDYEKLIHEVSLTQQRNLETVLLFSSTHLNHVSSSAAKELARFQGLIHGYVPIHVKAAIEKKLDQRIIGVTGTIGSGKSTLCKNLATPPKISESGGVTKVESLGNVHYINLDEIGHELLTNKLLPIAIETRARIEATFGTIDRKKLGEIVFGNPKALKELNEIYREPMLTLLREKLLGLKGTILVEGALLTEMDWLFLCNNRLIVVKTPSLATHTKRLASRGMTEEQINRRLASQYTYEEKLAKATDHIAADMFGRCIVHDTERDVPLEDTHAYIYVNNKLLD